MLPSTGCRGQAAARGHRDITSNKGSEASGHA